MSVEIIEEDVTTDGIAHDEEEIKQTEYLDEIGTNEMIERNHLDVEERKLWWIERKPPRQQRNNFHVR